MMCAQLQRVSFESVAFEARRCIQSVRALVAAGDRKLDLFDAAPVEAARDGRLEQAPPDALTGVLGRNVHAVEVSLVTLFRTRQPLDADHAAQRAVRRHGAEYRRLLG